MVNGTRSGLRNKDGESKSSGKKGDSREGISNASGRTATYSGSKQSDKGVLSGKTTSGPPSTRKSERLEKRTPPTTPVLRQSERLVNQGAPSPLRRSDRSKKNFSSSTSGSNQSGKNVSSVDTGKRKEKKENIIKQLAVGSQRLIASETYEQGSVSSKRKRMDAHSYKSLFKSQKRRYLRSDSDGRLERQDTLSQIDGEESGGNDPKLVQDIEHEGYQYDRALSPSVVLRAVKEHQGEPMRAGCSNNVSEETTDELDRVDGNISVIGGTNKATSNDSDTCPESAAQSGQLKVQNCPRDIQCEVIEKEIGDDIHALVVEGTGLTPSNLAKHEIIGSCVVCYKKQRLVYDSPEEELCSCSPVEKDTEDAEPTFRSGSIWRSDHDIGLNETLSDIQIDSNENICVKCKQPGELLYCWGKGCRRCYHCFCLDPILYDAPPGIWYCSFCTRKKIEFGIYTVTKGVESIWDAREVMVLDSKETSRQKQYLVKYQGLAHVYNHWIPESQLLLESPFLITKYNAEDQRRVWNPDWRVPSRLLRKRPVVVDEPEDQCSSLCSDNILDCQYEWLVKWCGLDYVDATWELENSNFLQSPQGQKLIREYEIRYEKAHRVVDKTTKGPFVKLKDRLSAGGSTLSDDCYLQNVNKLRELWYKRQNAVIFDEQERFANVIFFILSLSNDHQPFLIASNSESLSQWEAEFLRLAPSVDVVVYIGNIDSRTNIRKLEFQEKHKGVVVLQVLLAPIEVVIEDLQFLKSLKWKVVVIDGCQRASTDLEQLELLETDMRLLLFSGPIKDTGAVYSSLLSLLGSSDFPDKASDLKSDTDDNLVKLKELLSRFTAYSKFVEFLVPVEISNLQLEQYCGELLANASALRSNCRTDHVGAFKEILMKLRKCCDHPYMVAPSLQSSVIKGLTQDQVLEIGIEASGKLKLLYEILSKIRNLRLRALVLFQSLSSSGEMAIGDILDDFVRGKFGSNSYERIDACLIPSKKQAALNRFNAMGGEHFVFLLENRACQTSIKLSVDVVVIFDSDWNPANDLKALQRLSLHSRSGQVNVFRLYSSCTIEEKVLILGKQNMNLESSLQMIKFSNALLMWGASYLFTRLEEYHAGSRTDNVADISHGQKLLSDVLSELSAILSCSRKEDESELVISKVLRNAGTYTTNFPLLGEKKVQLIDMEVAHMFWKKLLEGKEPKWKFPLGQMPRSRKRVQYAQETSNCENDDTPRKRKKLLNTNLGVSPPQLELGEEQVEESNKETSMAAVTRQSSSLPVSVAITPNKLDSMNASSYPSYQGSSANLNCMAHLQEKSPSDEQKSLHSSVKEEMFKLCLVLKLTKEVQLMIDRFLDYIMENHHVNKEPLSILQAFQMSLCWTAASISKQKIDKKESLELAKKKLDFKCTEEEVISVYLKLRLLKKTFLQLPGVNSGSVSENIKSVSRNISSPSSGNTGESLSGSFNLQNVKANQELGQVQKSNNVLTGNDLKRRIKKIQKKCDKCILNIRQKHEMETQAFNKTWAERKEILETGHRKEVIFIRAIHGTGPTGMSKLKIAETEFARNMDDHEHLKETELKSLEEKHSAAIEEKKRIFDNWLTDAISCSNPCKTVTEVHTCGSESEGEIVPDSHSINIIPNLPVDSASETFGRENPAGRGPILLNLNSEKELESAIVEMPSIPGVSGKENCPSSQALEDIPSVDISSENHVTDELPSTTRNNNMPSGGTCNSGCETGHVHTIGVGAPDVDQYADETPLTNQNHERATGVSGNDGLEMGAIDASVELSLGNDKGDGTSQDVEDIASVDLSFDKRVCDELRISSQNNNMPSGGTCNTGFKTGRVHSIGIELSLGNDKGDGTSQDVEDIASVDLSFDKRVCDGLRSSSQNNHMPSGGTCNTGCETGRVHSIGIELSLGNDEGDGTSQDVEDIASVDLSFDNRVCDELHSSSQNKNMPSGGTCSTGCETGRVHSIGIGTPGVDRYAEETPLTNPYHEMATRGSGNDGREMGPDHNIDAPVGLSLGNDKGDATSDATRNQKDQHDVHITGSCPSDAVCLQNGESMDMQHEDIPVPGDLTTTTGTVPLTPSGGRTNSVSNLEESENNEQLEQASVDKDPGNCLSPAAENVNQGHYKESNSVQDAVGSSQLPESTEVPYQTVSQNVENIVPQPPVELLDSAPGWPDLLAANRADHTPNSELPTHSRGREAQVRQDVTELPNQAVSQPGPNSALVEASHTQLYGTRLVASLNASLPFHADPLQNELEKIHKEIEQVIKLHDNTKLLLKSDCEKEIEEMVAQIRKKYEAKMKSAEAVFVQKKNELESNQNKVLMNKILAEAFKSKCMDLRHTGISGVPKVAPSFTQHLHQLSLLPSRLSPAISQHTANLPIQSTHRSGNFSVAPTRPPLINAITPTVVNPRVGGEVRAPAPHLQPFRPPVCTSSNMPSVPYNPNQQVPVNVPVTSSSLSVHQPQKTSLMTSQFSQPNLPTLGLLPPANIIQSGPSNQLSETDGGAQPRSHSSTPTSALELLRNVHNQPSGNAPNILPCSGSDGGGVDVASGVVCLSDDDD